jgi:hypothetical protein
MELRVEVAPPDKGCDSLIIHAGVGDLSSAHYNHLMALTTLPQAKAWYVNSDLSFWSFTQELVTFAATMKVVIDRGDRSPDAFKFADLLLRAIELWKAGCVQDKALYAVENQPDKIWDTFRNALGFMNPKDDTQALLAIMELTGFGASVQRDSRQQPAKRASAVLRMFNPKEWGVVDWRTGYMLWALKKKNWNVPQAVTLAKNASEEAARKEWEMINEVVAVQLNEMYRAQRTSALPDTADVEMAVFGLSFEVWPVNQTIRNKHRLDYEGMLRGSLLTLMGKLNRNKS